MPYRLGYVPIYNIWWAEQDLNLQCILRHGFTVRLLQPICISTQKNGAEHKIRTCGPLEMNDRLATCWFKPLTQLSITVVTENKFRGPLTVSNPLGCTICGLDKRIRTFDPLVPSQVLYQTELHPDNNGRDGETRIRMRIILNGF